METEQLKPSINPNPIPVPPPPPHHSYIKVIVSLLVFVAILAGIYLYGLTWVQEKKIEEDAQSGKVIEKDDDLANIEASLQAMDVENSDKELNEIDEEFEPTQ